MCVCACSPVLFHITISLELLWVYIVERLCKLIWVNDQECKVCFMFNFVNRFDFCSWTFCSYREMINGNATMVLERMGYMVDIFLHSQDWYMCNSFKCYLAIISFSTTRPKFRYSCIILWHMYVHNTRPLLLTDIISWHISWA